MAGGQKSELNRLTIIGAATSNGSRSFSPVLPGIETQADWDAHLAGVKGTLSPGSYVENWIAYQAALTMRQGDRLNIYDRAATVRAMEEGESESFHYYDDDEEKPARLLVMESGVRALQERAAVAEHLIDLATVLTSMEPGRAIAPADGRLLLSLCFAAEAKAGGEIDEPPCWTWGVVQEGLAELAKASGKSVEKILLAVCKKAAEQRREALEAIEEGVPQLERKLLHQSTSLIHEYHSKVQNRLAKWLAIYGQVRAARLGLDIVQPVQAHSGGGNGDDGDIHS